jgi:hypothetical protein
LVKFEKIVTSENSNYTADYSFKLGSNFPRAGRGQFLTTLGKGAVIYFGE